MTKIKSDAREALCKKEKETSSRIMMRVIINTMLMIKENETM